MWESTKASWAMMRSNLAEAIDPSISQLRVDAAWWRDEAGRMGVQLSHRNAEVSAARYELASTKAEIGKLSAELNETAKMAVSLPGARADNGKLRRLIESMLPVVADAAEVAALELKATGPRAKRYQTLNERSGFLDSLVIAAHDTLK